MSILHYILLATFLLSVALARPPGKEEQEQDLTGADPMESEKFVDYFEDFFPVLKNSTKLHENYQYEKKKYLTSVLGYPPSKMRRFRK